MYRSDRSTGNDRIHSWNFLCLLAVLFGIITLAAAIEVVKDLEQVHIIFRHGDRAPLKRYKEDGYRAEDWPEGIEQLTARGISEQYALGKFLNQRYGNFLASLPGNINQKVLITASDHDRVLQSAAALAAGFFPPGRFFWKSDEKNKTGLAEVSLSDFWRPVSIHTVAKNQEIVLKQTAECPKLNRLNVEIYNDENSVVSKNLPINESRLQTLEMLLEEHAKDAGSTFWARANVVSDSLESLKNHNLPFPKWANAKNVFEELKIISDFMFFVYVGSNSKDKTRSRLTGGFLLDTILTRLSNTQSEKKLFLYAGHDSTIAGFRSALAMVNLKRNTSVTVPPFNALICVELFKNGTVRILENITGTDIEVLVHAKCNNAAFCSLKNLTLLAEPMRARNWTPECDDTQFMMIEEVPEFSAKGAWAAAAIVAAIIAIVFGIRWYRKRKLQQKQATNSAAEVRDPVVSYRTIDNHGF